MGLITTEVLLRFWINGIYSIIGIPTEPGLAGKAVPKRFIF